jgi:putative endonuclease
MACLRTSGLRKTGWLEQALGGLERLAHRRGRAKDLPAHLKVGTKGEDATFFYLRRKGYTVVARRWTSGDVPGDIDLIAWQGPMLCFIEVKCRSERTITPAEVAVDEHKRATLRRLARRYVLQLPQKAAPSVRFDVISVYLEAHTFDPSGDANGALEFQHFEAAFSWSEEYHD